MDKMEQDQTLTTEEARLYDRQIRLWGVNAQRRLGSARVFVHGFTGVMSELCKNIVLSGIHSLTINDGQVCTMRDLAGHLFLDQESVGHPKAPAGVARVQLLNPLVHVNATTTSLQDIWNASFTDYDIYIFSNVPQNEVMKLNAAARLSQKHFMLIQTHGMFGYMFEDFGTNFEYETTRENETTRHMISYHPFSDSIAMRWTRRLNLVYKFIRVSMRTSRDFDPTIDRELAHEVRRDLLSLYSLQDSSFPPEKLDYFIHQVNTELSPVCAIVGGVAAQEILKALCHNAEPANNFFCYDAADGSGAVIRGSRD